VHELIRYWRKHLQQQFHLRDGLLGFLSEQLHPSVAGSHDQSGRPDSKMETRREQLEQDVKQLGTQNEQDNKTRGARETQN
jgi:hypothetical protein